MAKLTRACGVVIVLLALSFSLAGTALAATSSGCGAWSVVSSPNRGTKSNVLSSVAAISADDIWAVGNAGHRTLTEHWNGKHWSVVKSPNLHFSNLLLGVAAIATNDVWAVGYSQHNLGYKLKYQTLAEHWDGTQWSIVPTPNPAKDSVFRAVTVISANNVWAVGWSNLATGLIEHWDGTQWSVVSFPSTNIFLYAVMAITANDIWASGTYSYTGQTLTEHWDGTQWSIVPTPGINASNNSLNSLSAVSTSDVWAVGSSFNHGQSSTLIEHWDGTQWSIIPGVSPGLTDNYLLGVTAISSNNVWAVGSYGDGNADNQALIEQWNGTQWSIIPGADPGTYNDLQAVAQVPTTAQLWTVGFYFSGGGNYHTLTESYC